MSPEEAETLKERAIRSRIFREIGISSPFRLHLVDLKGLEWYKRFKNLKKFSSTMVFSSEFCLIFSRFIVHV